MIIVLGVVIGLASLGSDFGGGATAATTLASLVTFVTVFVVFILLIPFMYLLYKWIVDFHWNDLLDPVEDTILALLLLYSRAASPRRSSRSASIGRAATLRLFRIHERDARHAWRSGARSSRLRWWDWKGLRPSLGQALLSLITIGIYPPWAYARISRWICEATTVEHAEPAPSAGVDSAPPVA